MQFNKKGQNMTPEKLARAFQVSEDDIWQFMDGKTYSKNQYDEIIVSGIDCMEMHDYFVHQITDSFDQPTLVTPF